MPRGSKGASQGAAPVTEPRRGEVEQGEVSRAGTEEEEKKAGVRASGWDVAGGEEVSRWVEVWISQ